MILKKVFNAYDEVLTWLTQTPERAETVAHYTLLVTLVLMLSIVLCALTGNSQTPAPRPALPQATAQKPQPCDEVCVAQKDLEIAQLRQVIVTLQVKLQMVPKEEQDQIQKNFGILFGAEVQQSKAALDKAQHADGPAVIPAPPLKGQAAPVPFQPAQ